MISIAVIDDEKNERDSINEFLLSFEKEENKSFEIRLFDSAMGFLESYDFSYDLILMDVEMPGLNGFDAATEIRKKDKNVVLIFITNIAQYAIRGYEVDALDYIVKPLDKYSFRLKMERALLRCPDRNGESIAVDDTPGGGSVVSLQKRFIIYLESQGHYVLYHTTQGTYREYSSFKKAVEKVGSENFVFCNRCYYVNLKYVSEIKKDIAIVNGEELLISRPQHKQFEQRFVKYIGGN